jgi:hypothetical protein
MWYFHQDTGSLHNEAHPELRVDASSADGILNLATKNGSSGQKKFDWILSNQMLTGSGYSWTIDHDTNHVKVEPNEFRRDQKWWVEYCYGR